MSTSRYEDAPGHRSIMFHCDADHCDEELETGYSMWNYGVSCAKENGWYILPDDTVSAGWVHLCPSHGKTEWIKRKRAEEEQ